MEGRDACPGPSKAADFTKGGGVDRPTTLSDTLFSVNAVETASGRPRGETKDFTPSNRPDKVQLTRFRIG